LGRSRFWLGRSCGFLTGLGTSTEDSVQVSCCGGVGDTWWVNWWRGQKLLKLVGLKFLKSGRCPYCSFLAFCFFETVCCAVSLFCWSLSGKGY
jgi:hypothetical protein